MTYNLRFIKKCQNSSNLLFKGVKYYNEVNSEIRIWNCTFLVVSDDTLSFHIFGQRNESKQVIEEQK